MLLCHGEALATIAKYLLSSSTMNSVGFQGFQNPQFGWDIFPRKKF